MFGMHLLAYLIYIAELKAITTMKSEIPLLHLVDCMWIFMFFHFLLTSNYALQILAYAIRFISYNYMVSVMYDSCIEIEKML